MVDGNLTVNPPLYLTGMKVDCWRCGNRMPVVALVAPNIEGDGDEVSILTDIVTLPREVLSYIQQRVPTFELKYSKTVERAYYGNVCPKCHTLSGDFFLHSEPEAPFFPIDKEQASCLYLTEVPIRGPVSIQASFHVGAGELVLENAKRIA